MWLDDELELCKSWGEKALSSNNPLAIGYCHYEGLGTPKNLNESSKFFEIAANDGNQFAQFMLALSLYHGLGVEKNFEKSYSWYMKSAEQGMNFKNAKGLIYSDMIFCL